MKRRNFIANSALMIGAAPLLRLGAASSRQTEVLVVGAGMAGLAAAQTLQAQGIPVVVLEARQRSGGRVWTDRSWPDAPLDMGASWIHGIRGNPIYKLARQLKLATHPTDYDAMTVYEVTGRPLSDADATALDALLEQTLARARRAGRALVDDISLQEGLELAWQNQPPPDRQTRRRLDYVVNTTIEHEYAGDTGELSFFYFDHQGAYPGGDVLFLNGYDQLVTHLGQGLDIRLEHVVEQISYHSSGVTVTTNRGEFQAEAAIITLPLGVLKSGRVSFSPALPPAKQRAIERLGMGLLNKLYLRFERPFWPAEAEMLGYIPPLKGRWAEFLNIHFYTGQPILLAFNAATYARSLEKLPDETAVDAALSTLRRIFGHRLPDPTGYRLTRWAADPFAGGAYSFMAAGATPQDINRLAQPVADRLFFAGEATHRRHPATVHGAYLSGQRAAREVINRR
ncbi:MAG: FAD-dependent oxidoreductase [Anaerolineae bacterium]